MGGSSSFLLESDSPSGIWEFLVDSGSIRPQDYDCGLVGLLFERAGLSREQFMVALLGALQPFARMMSELCEFFERHDVRGTGEGLKMRFRFEDAADELSFDLEYFRETLARWEQVRATLEAIGWTVGSLWELSHCFEPDVSWDDRHAGPRTPAAREWVEKNMYPAREHARMHWSSPLPPVPPPVGAADVDEWVARVHAVLTMVAMACAPYADYRELYAAAHSQSGDAVEDALIGETGQMVEDWPVRELQRLESDPGRMVEDWPVRELQHLESDYFSGALAAALWIWVERLQGLPLAELQARARPVVAELDRVFASRPRGMVEVTQQVERLAEFLDLPIWKRRHSLYQAWLVPVVEKALHRYPVEIHHDDGVLRFGFAKTHIATFTAEEGAVRLFAELKSPMRKPKVRKSRTENVQPDYVLVGGDTEDSTLVVLETKQYLRSSVKNFGEALSDYVDAHPEATVIVANYGPMSPNVMAALKPEVARWARAIGDVRPQSVDALRELQRAIVLQMPPPPGGPAADDVREGADLIVVDVSASMDEDLGSPSVIDALRRLAEESPDARWLAIDTEVRFSGTGVTALEGVLGVSRDGSTDLPAALTEEHLRGAVLVTDADGRSQFADTDGLRALGIVSRGSIEWIDLPAQAGSD
ncbi:MAG TPA: hypothetical protein VF101_00695 [Gaiellaceae bacterium]